MLKPFPQPVLEACHKAAQDHFAELSGRDLSFKKAFESANAFRKEQVQWWQIAEQAYDSLTLGTRGRV